MLAFYCINQGPVLAQEPLQAAPAPVAQPDSRPALEQTVTVLEAPRPEQKSEAIPAGEEDPDKCRKYKIAGLDIAVWSPLRQGKVPLVIFSHGSGGKNTRYSYITRALAECGYLVIAPNHHDSTLTGISLRPDFTFKNASRWNDKMYEARRNDIVNLIAALHQDPRWDSRIDWLNLALCGHSLGGYTVFGLGGAWPAWKMEGIKALLGYSPYCQPFVLNGRLDNISVPVMYQGGTRDKITESVIARGGAFDQTAAPVYFVEFQGAGHLAWTNFKHKQKQRDLIIYYTIGFLDKFLKAPPGTTGDTGPGGLDTKLDGVAVLEKK